MTGFGSPTLRPPIAQPATSAAAKVTALAEERGLDAYLAADLWTKLMDWNIEWERQAIAARAAGKKQP